jgi:hypothetical protein
MAGVPEWHTGCSQLLWVRKGAPTGVSRQLARRRASSTRASVAVVWFIVVQA